MTNEERHHSQKSINNRRLRRNAKVREKRRLKFSLCVRTLPGDILVKIVGTGEVINYILDPRGTWMSLSIDSLPEPTECQGQRDHYVTGSFWWLWSLTGELVDRFSVSITQSPFKGNLKKAWVLLALRFMTGNCWCEIYLFIHPDMFQSSILSKGRGGKQSIRWFIFPHNFLQLGVQNHQAFYEPSKTNTFSISSQFRVQGIGGCPH